jgi:hypothetical protein
MGGPVANAALETAVADGTPTARPGGGSKGAMTTKMSIPVLLLACFAWFSPAVASEAPSSDYRVVPIIFVPTDYAHHFENRSIVDFYNDKILEAQRFFSKHNGGKTFQALPLKVVLARHDRAWYWRQDNGNFEYGVLKELQDRGYPVHVDWDLFPANRAVWVLAMGSGGWAGGRHYPNGGGFAMWGDALLFAAMDSSCRRVVNVKDGDTIEKICKTSWLPSGKIYGFGVGGAIHELGHAFNLPHPPDGSPDWQITVMGYHWSYPATGLSARDREMLASSPYMSEANAPNRK